MSPESQARPAPPPTSQLLPLCVDCDGTLIKTDLLFESFLLLLKKHFLLALCVPFWLITRGKARTKLRIAELVTIDAALLPYSSEVLEYIARCRAQHRSVVLATASAQKFADAIARHLNCFDLVLATNAQDGVNLSAGVKAERLVGLYGQGGFEYLGNSSDDLPVWRQAGRIAVAHASGSVLKAARQLGTADQIAVTAGSTLRAAVKAMRPHQWLKNLLIFVPLAMAHRLQHTTLLHAMLAFASFGLCASSVYLLNDMLDIESDRAHHSKKRRPFASGALSIPAGALLLATCLGGSALLLWALPPLFAVMLGIYYITTLAYSFRLKRQVMVDIMLLSALYTLRILAGAAATAVVPSFWLLSFSVFIFLSLALVKRYAEMRTAASMAHRKASGRGYSIDDLPVLLALGVASGFSAVQVLALYINSVEVNTLYHTPQVLWIIMPLMLYWISRIWLKTCRGEMHEDPVVFAAKDWQSIVIGAAVVAVSYVASLKF